MSTHRFWNYGKKGSLIALFSDVSILPSDHLTNLLLYGSKAFNSITNELILTETILFIYKSERFKHLEAFSWSFFNHPNFRNLTQRALRHSKPCEPHQATLFVSLFIVLCISTFFFSLVSVWWDSAASNWMPVPVTHKPSFCIFVVILLFF